MSRATEREREWAWAVLTASLAQRAVREPEFAESAALAASALAIRLRPAADERTPR